MQSLPDVHYYLPVNDDAMRWGIYLTGIGRATIPPASVYPPHIHPHLYNFRWELGRELPEFAVVLVSEGSGLFESKATGLVRVARRSLIFLFPGVWHRYRPAQETGWTERWFCFNGELAHRLMEMALLQAEVPIRRATDAALLVGCLDELIEKVLVDPARNSILLSLHALGLLGTVIEAAADIKLPSALEPSGRRDVTSDAIVSQALAWIWTRGHQAISVEQIAEAAAVTQRTLERRFQQSVGHSIVEEIIACRLNRAKRLLEETEMPIKVVAYLAGFPTQQRMRIAFVQREHISPLKFRRRARRRHSDMR
jgi:AraC-like DNA-binding protein